MRILITLATALLSVATAATGGVGAAPRSAGGPPCEPTPHTTAWTWPLGAAPARAAGGAAAAVPASGAVSTSPPVLRPFEPPEHRWDPGHRGVDLAGSVGEPVVAAGAGIVLFAGRVVGRNVLVVGHGALRTSYEPVDAAVAPGARVAAGQFVGTLDAGHCAATACLHWGLLSGNGHATVYYDPLLLLGCGAVRLEPAG